MKRKYAPTTCHAKLPVIDNPCHSEKEFREMDRFELEICESFFCQRLLFYRVLISIGEEVILFFSLTSNFQIDFDLKFGLNLNY